MSDKRPEVKTLEAIEDPAQREVAARAAIEDARELMSAVSNVRAEAVADLVGQDGATATAERLGISRAGVYRIMGPDLTTRAQGQRQRALAETRKRLRDQMADLKVPKPVKGRNQ